MLEVHLAGEVLHVRRLQPALQDLVIREVVGVLQIQQSDHHPNRQRGAARALRRRREQVGDLLNDALPGHRICKPDQWMIRPDNLIQASSKQIVTAMVLLITRRRSMAHQKPIRYCKETAHIIPVSCNHCEPNPTIYTA
jgi:hypothetical protein